MAKEKMRVLGLGAHPDDMEWMCGGTMPKFARLGHEVFLCHVSNGDKGSFRYGSEELAKVRRAEAIASAAVIGARSLTCDIPDGEVVLTVENERRVTEVIRQAAPDVVIAMDPSDYHGDHRAVGEMAIHCTFMASCPLYKTATPATKNVPLLYFCDTLTAVNFTPTDYVDVTEDYDTKLKMMLAHASQLEWVAQRGADDMMADFKVVSRLRGMQCGVKYAEAFRVCPTAARAVPYRVLP